MEESYNLATPLYCTSAECRTRSLCPPQRLSWKATCKTLAEALGIRELTNFLLHADTALLHHTDATACLGILKRKGAGSVKHLSVRQLWVQEAMTLPKTSTCKIARAANPADFLCSLPQASSREAHMRATGYAVDGAVPFEGGRVSQMLA